MNQGIIWTVNGLPLEEWALQQDLSDGLPRTRQEIEYIRTTQHIASKKRKAHRLALEGRSEGVRSLT